MVTVSHPCHTIATPLPTQKSTTKNAADVHWFSMDFTQLQVHIITYLVAWYTYPLWYIRKSVGMMTFPINMDKESKCSSHHQPNIGFHVKFALPKGEHSGIPASPSHLSYFSFSGSTFNSAEILASPGIYWIDVETMGKPDKIAMVFHGYLMLPARSKLYGMNICVIMWYCIWHGRYFSIPNIMNWKWRTKPADESWFSPIQIAILGYAMPCPTFRHIQTLYCWQIVHYITTRHIISLFLSVIYIYISLPDKIILPPNFP